MQFRLAFQLPAIMTLAIASSLNPIHAADRSYDVLGVKVGVELDDGIDILKRALNSSKYELHQLDARRQFKKFLSRDFCRTHLPLVAGLQDSIVATADYQTVSLYFDSRESPPKIHTIIRIIDLKKANIRREDVLAALEDKLGKSTARLSDGNAWGNCAPNINMIEEIHNKNSAHSMALSPDEIRDSRYNRNCVLNLTPTPQRRFEFMFGPGVKNGQFYNSINLANVLMESEFVDGNYTDSEIVDNTTGNLKGNTTQMFMPDLGLRNPNSCSVIAFVKFFDFNTPLVIKQEMRGEKAMIFVSSTAELTINMSRTIRELKSSSQPSKGKGDVKF